MEMKVDSHLIKSERKKRAWSQEHLAGVSGLGHRTIQRIENTGLASYESVMAIAAALDLDTAALRIEDSDVFSSVHTSYTRRLPIKLELPARLVLAVLSGILVPVILAAAGPLSRFGSATPDYFGRDYLIYPFCGALFGLTVLCPYLKRDSKLLLNSLTLTVASAISFTGSYWVSMFLLGINELLAFMAASLFGTTIVVFASKRTIPLGKTHWLRFMFAAIAGGAAVYTGLVFVGDFEFDTLAAVLGFCSWHCVMSLALHYGRSIDESGNHPGSILMEFLVWVTGKGKLPGYYFDAGNLERPGGFFSLSRSQV